jgi:hypothetical protein
MCREYSEEEINAAAVYSAANRKRCLDTGDQKAKGDVDDQSLPMSSSTATSRPALTG